MNVLTWLLWAASLTAWTVRQVEALLEDRRVERLTQAAESAVDEGQRVSWFVDELAVIDPVKAERVRRRRTRPR